MQWTFGDIEVVRVGQPGFDLTLPQDDVTVAILQLSPWLQPTYVTDDWSLRIGSSTLVVRTPDATVLVDPWLAFDDPSTHTARLSALRDAGFDPADIDVVVNTHIDGIGANVAPGTSEPAFPKARYLVPAAEIESVREGVHPGAEAWLDLVEAGTAEAIEAPYEVVPGVRLEWLRGHNAGHVGVEIGSPTAAIIVGHLFLHPAQIANPGVTDPGEDAEVIHATRDALLTRCVDEEIVVIAPLFAEPGGGRVQPQGGAWALVPPE